ncbi:tryptophan halogenase family protein [Paraglaciecola sp.]|uniref:tryptophan halogenase family protein n=1 Tax=Paraglaciecola sp. TaxID=1920173 RepID=UPI003EF7A319
MDKKTKVVIAGGGTSGWLTASALAMQMGDVYDITLVESSAVGSVGVGEATIPPMKSFHKFLNINEREFMQATQATFKLGIEFENWKQVGEKYFHSFGETGKNTMITEFLHFWMRGKELGVAKEFGDYCLEFKAALANKIGDLQQVTLNHAYHLDASLYAKYLKNIACKNGVKHYDGLISRVHQNYSNGYISSLELASGQIIEGDFFVDCTGFKALLIEKTLHSGFEDWSHWLPCDRAIAVQTALSEDIPPYTRSIAHQAGWQWKIPLQHRAGNGLVYSSRYMSDEQAKTSLLANISGDPLTDLKVIKFNTGRRRNTWVKNCLAIGLSAGFLEPLESTSIHLIMTAITRLLQLGNMGDIPQCVIDEYNQQASTEMEQIRDFIILHYKQTERQDSPFWRYCKNMEIPDKLAHRMSLFKSIGKSYQTEGELFRLDSWTQVMLGQGLEPEKYHPIAKTFNNGQLTQFLATLELDVSNQVSIMPNHQSFIKSYCKH